MEKKPEKGQKQASFEPSPQRIDDLERKVIQKHGFLLTGEHLRCALSYGSLESLRQAIMRDTIPVKVFEIKGRRGKFTTARRVAHWLAQFDDPNETVVGNNVEDKLGGDSVT